MYFKEVSEKQTIDFIKGLLDYYGTLCSGSTNIIYTSNDFESLRNNVGWYRYENNEHRLCLNVPNMLYALNFIRSGIIDVDAFYAFVTLCTGHEFRHFEQGTCIYDGKEMNGYDKNDVYNSELMLYIRYFFDAYYLLNKGYVKYEIDAEKFAVENGVKYLKEAFPNMDAETAMVNAVNFYASIQNGVFGLPTLPFGCNSVEEITNELSERIKRKQRVPDLTKTLQVHNPNFYEQHSHFNLDEEKILTPELVKEYKDLNDSTDQDLLVVKKILSSIEKPEESLVDFPGIQKKYTTKKL